MKSFETIVKDKHGEKRRVIVAIAGSYAEFYAALLAGLLAGAVSRDLGWQAIDTHPVEGSGIEPVSSQEDALRKFKAYVHARLDAAGIPTHPDGPHSKEGCRIGDRLDILLAERGHTQKEGA